MPSKRPKFDPEEAEDYLKFIADLEDNPRKTSGAGHKKEERKMLAQELFFSSQDTEDPLETLSLALRAVRLDPACLDARTKRKVPENKVPYFSPGDMPEAIECMAMIGAAWKKNPAAIAWLKDNRPKARRNYVWVKEAE